MNTPTNASDAAANYASACQSLLSALPSDQRNSIARAVIVVVGSDGSKSIFEVDGEETVDSTSSSVRDMLVYGGLSEYLTALRTRLIEKLK